MELVVPALIAAANSYMRDVDAITGSHPARVITILTDPTEDQMPVQAWVSIHCQVPPAGGRQRRAAGSGAASGRVRVVTASDEH